jgi:transcriptional regulator GlxA family with amidase domain
LLKLKGMKHLTILVPDGEVNMSSITGTFKIFAGANAVWKEKKGAEMFKIQLVGITTELKYSEEIFSVRPHACISDIVHTDLVIIPSLDHNYQKALDANKPIIAWLSQQYKAGTQIASICTGGFLLAATGILDGKSCSTHWADADVFRGLFPKVKLKPDLLITDENGLFTNGGAFSFLNFMIYLVEKFYDRSTAIYCSKVFQIAMDRNNQSEFSIFTGQKRHDDEVIKEAQAYIESRPEEKISVEELSSKFSLSRRNFDRRFLKATGNSPLEYAQRVKIEVAKRAFENTRKNINEVMYEVGYADQKTFRDIFRKITGLSPLEYRGKYNRIIAQ